MVEYLLAADGDAVAGLHPGDGCGACLDLSGRGSPASRVAQFLSQYVSPDVAQKLDEIGTVSLGGVRRELSLLFTDIAGFTTISEQLDERKA